jgi:CPA1 family monovalent cation:H+ antiporter
LPGIADLDSQVDSRTRIKDAMENATAFLLLFIIATTVAIVVRRFHIPYTAALVLTGLALGYSHFLNPPHLTKNFLFTAILPGLLFEAAFHLDSQQFWRNRWTIISLSVPGVIAAIILTTLILTQFSSLVDSVQEFSWRYALVFGALISATDPIAVVATFRTLRVSKRLSLIVEGESLINDGTGIVFFSLSLSLLSGKLVSAGSLVLQFIAIVGVGLLIGGLVGLIISQVIKRVEDTMIAITATTIAAYGSFLAAEQFHYSGVIAAVMAGLICGNKGNMAPSTRIALASFWEYVAFALNSIVFLLIGFEVNMQSLLDNWPMILAAYLAVTLGRAMVVLVASAIMRLTPERLPWSWSAVMTWGGLRGALPMVLVLSLPPDFPHRELLVTMTFGVVLLSIMIQGVTMSPLLRWLKMGKPHYAHQVIELARGRLMAAYAGLDALDRLAGGRLRNSPVVNILRDEYEKKISTIEQDMQESEPDYNHYLDQDIQWARRHLLLVEKNRIIDNFQAGRLSQKTYDKLLTDIDARLLEVETEL